MRDPRLNLQFDWRFNLVIWALLIIAVGTPIVAWLALR